MVGWKEETEAEELAAACCGWWWLQVVVVKKVGQVRSVNKSWGQFKKLK